MPWPKGKKPTPEMVARRVASLVVGGKRRRRSVEIEGVSHWRCSTRVGWFPGSAFYVSGKQTSGLSSQCRRCHTASNLSTRDAELARDTNRAYMARARASDPEKFRAREREASRVRGVTPRTRARMLLNAAVRRGAVARPDACGRCRRRCRTHGHHDDYSKPLSVRWLCTLCHGLEHRRFDR